MANLAHSLSHPVTKGTKGVQLNVYALQEDTSVVKGTKVSVISDANTALTGTATSSGTAVTGTTAAFDTELTVGDIIFVAASGEYREVVSITDADNLVVDSAFTTALSANTVQKADSVYHTSLVADAKPFQGHLYFEDSVRSNIAITADAKVVSLAE